MLLDHQQRIGTLESGCLLLISKASFGVHSALLQSHIKKGIKEEVELQTLSLVPEKRVS